MTHVSHWDSWLGRAGQWPALLCMPDISLRVVEIGGEPWFVAKDVCDDLRHSNPTVAIPCPDSDERTKQSLGRQGNVNLVSESGLDILVIRSNKPEAHAFRKWVTSFRRSGATESI